MANLFIPKPGDRVRVIAVGPLDAYADNPTAIGTVGTVAKADRSGLTNGWIYCEFAENMDHWCFAECRVEAVA